MRDALRSSALSALLMGLVGLPLIGLQTVEIPGGLNYVTRWPTLLGMMALVFALRLAMLLVPRAVPAGKIKILDISPRIWKWLPVIAIVAALAFPFLPFTDRYQLDVATLVLTYLLLGWALNVTVGYAGLLDLGCVAFYALGAYAMALLSIHLNIDFWMALPLAGLMAALLALLLGAPVLRLRGDYFAIVTLGLGEIMRILLINWTSLTGGPNGISGIPRPTLFGLEFSRRAPEGQSFHEFFHLEFDSLHRIIFLYYVILLLTLAVGWLTTRIRHLPLGRAWEALREDDIACTALGLNRTPLRLAAYALAAFCGGLAGAFFATRQGFISPESFTFMESALVLSIVVLGGMGSPLGIALAAILLVGMPELFREFEQYRMLAFGAGMVLVMLWRPQGLAPARQPAVRLQPRQGKT